ncbi:MAG: hypothetical protein JXJ22_09215 [Bacteroidales bacterium]|nr:hypothetical protein [Bacteroidales bacterium]
MTGLFRVILWIFFLATLFVNCSVEEGEGGSSTIKGKVYSKTFNNTFTSVINEYYKPEEDVYIVYGEGEIYDDRFKTNYDGSFQFEYLQQGTYTIFVYSIDTNSESIIKVPVKQTVNITKNHQEIELEDLIVIETGDYDEGFASITGKVFVLDYDLELTTLLDTYYGPDERVYIIYGNDPVFFDDVRTSYDGTFQFNNLVKGTYTIYALSENLDHPSVRQLIPVKKTVTINNNYENIIIDDIVIIK